MRRVLRPSRFRPAEIRSGRSQPEAHPGWLDCSPGFTGGSPDEPLIMVALLQFGAEPVIGWKDKNGFDCPRLPGESEEDLLASAETEARTKATPQPWGGIVLQAYSEPTR
jgi:hypothetical protein